MKISVLMENATPSGRFTAEHGLSLFLEAGNRRILFDMGPDGAFLDNARTLGVDVREADFAVVSHGHYDHGGGLRAYLDLAGQSDDAAPIYISARAFEEHAAREGAGYRDIGITADLEPNPRFVKTGDFCELGEGMFLFSNVQGTHPIAESNKNLLQREGTGYVSDSFAHEQSLVVVEGERRILVSGCSHCGILNIMDRAEELLDAPLDAVVGGFHLMDPGTGLVEDDAATRQLARELAARPSTYFTFHCTGLDAFSLLRDELGERVRYLYAGCTADV